MLFNSYVFIFLLLPITLAGYFGLNRYKKEKYAKAWLVVSSLYFYAYFNYSYLLIIICSILCNYCIAQTFHSKKCVGLKRQLTLLVGVGINVGIIGYYKYYDFFIGNINELFSSNISLMKVLLPLGISFFTFQQLSFVVDSYRRKGLQYDFLSYCLFVSFFPQLIAGPIVLPEEMLPQFEDNNNKKINYKNLYFGLSLFILGLAKKVLIADSISSCANAGFAHDAQLTCLEGWITSISYTMQLYFDFSGYCDMAMGVALMFNIMLPVNFNSPYRSTNFQEFWQRWHITLGRFFTKYLYIPLGGSRCVKWKVYRNLIIVFILSGLWHGAGWTFIVWGALHGVCILVHRIWQHAGFKMPKLLGWFITFNLVNIFWIFFRSLNYQQAVNILHSMFNFENFTLSSDFISWARNDLFIGRFSILVWLVLALAVVLSLCFKTSRHYAYLNSKVMQLLLSILFIVSTIFLHRVSEFLYFNF